MISLLLMMMDTLFQASVYWTSFTVATVFLENSLFWFPWHRAGQNLVKMHLKMGSNPVPGPRLSIGQTNVLVSFIGGMTGWDEMELENALSPPLHLVILGGFFCLVDDQLIIYTIFIMCFYFLRLCLMTETFFHIYLKMTHKPTFNTNPQFSGLEFGTLLIVLSQG